MKTNALTLVITLVVGIILAGSLLAPVISDAQKTITPVTLENEAITNNFAYKMWDNESITISYVGGSHPVDEINDLWLINGEPAGINFAGVQQRILFASDAVCARVGGGTSSAITVDVEIIGNTAGVQGLAFNWEIAADGTYTLTLNPTGTNPTVKTGTITWLIYASGDGDLNLLQLGTPTEPFYTGTSDDLIVLGNVFTTAENDTFYSYYNGKLTVNEEYMDNSDVTITKTIAEGYTDIYNTTITVNIDGESFTPYFILAPKVINGHEAGGATYTLLGAIPIMVIVAILMVAVGAIAFRRAD